MYEAQAAGLKEAGFNRVEGGGEAVGLLGEISKVQALACLMSCPLLEDLSEWSQWDLVFKPFHGSLKEFIQRNAGRWAHVSFSFLRCL